MSTQRGNVKRTRCQKHQNVFAFKNDLHDKTVKTKNINSLDVAGVCNRCKEVIEWKIRYKKYKPLTVPKKCTKCDGKTIQFAYHIVCQACAKKLEICAKCGSSNKEIVAAKPTAAELIKQNQEFEQEVKNLTERKRRTMMRYLAKGESTKTEQLKDLSYKSLNEDDDSDEYESCDDDDD